MAFAQSRIGPPVPHELDPNYDPTEGLTDEQVDALLGLHAPQLNTQDYSVAPQSRGSAALQGLSGLEQQNYGPATGFGVGFAGGLARGLGSAGTRVAQERAKMEQSATQRMQARDAANLEATRTYRNERFTATQAEKAAQRGSVEKRLAEQQRNQDQADKQKELTPGTPEYRARLTRMREEAVAGHFEPSGAHEPIVAIETPEGPRYVRQSEAVGHSPVGPKAQAPRPPSAGERGELVTDIGILGEVQGIKSAFAAAPHSTGPVAGPLGSALQRVGLTGKASNALRGRVAGLRNQILKARSGGAVTDGEASRLLEELPISSDAAGPFMDKLAQFENVYRDIASARRQVFSGTGIDISKIPELPGAAASAVSGGSFFDAAHVQGR